MQRAPLPQTLTRQSTSSMIIFGEPKQYTEVFNEPLFGGKSSSMAVPIPTASPALMTESLDR